MCYLLQVTAVENLERLVEIPGVNGLLVGPHDLSCNFAVPEEWTSDVFHNAIGKIIDVSSIGVLAEESETSKRQSNALVLFSFVNVHIWLELQTFDLHGCFC